MYINTTADSKEGICIFFMTRMNALQWKTYYLVDSLNVIFNIY